MSTADVYKHIVLCVDQTPSMNCKIRGGTIIEAVNEGVSAFIGVFEEKGISANLTSLTFDTECRATPPVKIASFTPKYKAKESGKACLVDALKMASDILVPFENTYIVLVSDGVLEPGEKEESLSFVFSDMGKCRCHTVGFSGENGEEDARVLLDFFTNRQLLTFSSKEEFKKRFSVVAEEIISAEVPGDEDGKGENVAEGW